MQSQWVQYGLQMSLVLVKLDLHPSFTSGPRRRVLEPVAVPPCTPDTHKAVPGLSASDPRGNADKGTLLSPFGQSHRERYRHGLARSLEGSDTAHPPCPLSARSTTEPTDPLAHLPSSPFEHGPFSRHFALSNLAGRADHECAPVVADSADECFVAVWFTSAYCSIEWCRSNDSMGRRKRSAQRRHCGAAVRLNLCTSWLEGVERARRTYVASENPGRPELTHQTSRSRAAPVQIRGGMYCKWSDCCSPHSQAEGSRRRLTPYRKHS